MTLTQINLSTAHARLIPRAVTLFDLQQQRTLWQRSLERLEDAGLGWCKGAQDLRDKLAASQRGVERYDIEMAAARRAYAAGLGAGEWEAFLTDEEHARLAAMEGAE